MKIEMKMEKYEREKKQDTIKTKELFTGVYI